MFVSILIIKITIVYKFPKLQQHKILSLDFLLSLTWSFDLVSLLTLPTKLINFCGSVHINSWKLHRNQRNCIWDHNKQTHEYWVLCTIYSCHLVLGVQDIKIKELNRWLLRKLFIKIFSTYVIVIYLIKQKIPVLQKLNNS